MDKDGIALRAWASLGFGHVELGTVTAQPQPGNTRPRLFRLPHSRALVNRMGFNNAGAAALADRLAAAGVVRGNRALGIPVGVSIGKTKTTPLTEAAEDYLTSLRLLAPYVDYLAVNADRKSTRLNSSHANISHAVSCLKKKNYWHAQTLLHSF